MNTTTRPIRDNAIAAANAETDRSVAAAQASRPTAIANMANRLHISQQQLVATLKATVFRGASDNEFAALIVVADAYKLNPLLKEIYAFPVKGGGIAPMVSIDGWIRIVNDHPEFDGIEFRDMADDKGKLYAIEATIFRKDRARPTQIIEYLEECKRNTDPWNKSPARMLRHRALMQCARYAFGFSGLATEDDAEYITPLTPQMRDVTPPARGSAALPGPAASSSPHNDDGEVVDDPKADADDGAEQQQDPAAAVGRLFADDGGEAEQEMFETISGKIRRAKTQAEIGKAVASIPETMRETWQTGLRDLAIERGAELQGGGK